MSKNVWVCGACHAPTIGQAPIGKVTPFMVRCRAEGCRGAAPKDYEFAQSTMYRYPQDMLGAAHVEFEHDEKGVLTGSKILRPVPAYQKSAF